LISCGIVDHRTPVWTSAAYGESPDVLQRESHAPARGRGNQPPADYVRQSPQTVSDFPPQEATAAVVKYPECGLIAQTATVAAVREFPILQPPDDDLVGRYLPIMAP